jgi:hypothetical protein
VTIPIHRIPDRTRARASRDLAHAQAPDQKAPFDPGHSWLLGDQKTAAVVLAVTAAALLVAGGLGLWAHAGWWRGVAAIGLAASFGPMVAYFNPWYQFIEAVNAALTVGIVALSWPSRTMVGA